MLSAEGRIFSTTEPQGIGIPLQFKAFPDSPSGTPLFRESVLSGARFSAFLNANSETRELVPAVYWWKRVPLNLHGQSPPDILLLIPAALAQRWEGLVGVKPLSHLRGPGGLDHNIWSQVWRVSQVPPPRHL
jgi:hypothetical protein